MPFVPALTRQTATIARTHLPARFAAPLTRATRYSGFTLPFAFFGTSSSSANSMGEEYPVKKSDSQWRAELSPEQVRAVERFVATIVLKAVPHPEAEGHGTRRISPVRQEICGR